MMKIGLKRAIAVLGFVCVLLSANAVAQDGSSMLSGKVIPLEANSVELVMSSSATGGIAQILVDGCEVCATQSYLPARDIEVSLSGSELSASQYPEVNGLHGTLVIDANTKLVKKVKYSLPRGEGDQQ